MEYNIEKCANRYLIRIGGSKLYFVKTPHYIEVQDIYLLNDSNYEQLIKACIDLSFKEKLGLFFHKFLLHL